MPCSHLQMVQGDIFIILQRSSISFKCGTILCQKIFHFSTSPNNKLDRPKKILTPLGLWPLNYLLVVPTIRPAIAQPSQKFQMIKENMSNAHPGMTETDNMKGTNE
ncbi:hypothetical protein CHS0354_025831 [Potamilus streckersoni]|uniref:Uncharacterized protein n=1 Tax=Potamilus streckersoni TaxID=2493646 RepID=A0AAE0SUT2_9BIVA|nr:hypothetical protein CHS0354_025831 [Potamilus streckersoni]